MRSDPGNRADVLLRASSVGFSHPGAPLFEGLSFELRPGLVWVLGGDGRGKTTLLRLIAGTLAPTAGTLWRADVSVHDADPTDPRDDGTVARDWLHGRRLAAPAWDSARADALADALALGPHLDKALFRLSTGTRRKLGLVAAFAGGARIVALDMPFAGLDARSRAVLRDELATAAADRRRAFVVADHAVPQGLEGLAAPTIDLGS